MCVCVCVCVYFYVCMQGLIKAIWRLRRLIHGFENLCRNVQQ